MKICEKIKNITDLIKYEILDLLYSYSHFHNNYYLLLKNFKIKDTK